MKIKILFVLFLCSCQTTTNSSSIGNKEFTFNQDSLLPIESKIVYDVKEADSTLLKEYVLSDFKIKFVNCILKNGSIKRKIEIGHEEAVLAEHQQHQFEGLPMDQMEILTDYTESEFYTVKGNPSMVVVISKPMNWSGSMSQYSLCQIINLRDNNYSETIRKDL